MVMLRASSSFEIVAMFSSVDVIIMRALCMRSLVFLDFDEAGCSLQD